MSLVLRSADDFIDANGNRLSARVAVPHRASARDARRRRRRPSRAPAPRPVTPFPCEITPGIVLDSLIEQYGVLIVGIDGSAIGAPGPTPEPEPTPAESPAESPAP